MSLNNTTDECRILDGKYPTAEEFYKGLQGYAISLYVASAVVVGVLLVQFLILVFHFWKYVPGSRRVPTLWVNSVYLVVAIATLFSIALPNATDFVWLFYKVYLAMAMGYFVDLTMAWFGGESELLRIVGEGTEIKMRTPPCCCCFCICPKPVPFTKNIIQILRGSVYQSAYIQAITVFLIVVLTLTDHLTIGDLHPKGPFLYLTSISLISFMVGLWALFVFFNITHQFELLHDYKYKQKSGLLKAIVVLVNIQGFIIETLANYNVIGCVPPYISSTAMASVIKSILCLFESFVLGSLAFRLYVLDYTHL